MIRGPEAFASRDPLEAGASITPQYLITTEGQEVWKSYDVSDPIQAEEYLVEVHHRVLPRPGGEIDKRTNYHLALALRDEKRAALDSNLEHQNVAEHTFFLSISATTIAANERPDLDRYKVGALVKIHDLIEAYCGDTIITDEEAMKHKQWKEAAAMTRIRHDLAGSPILDDLEEYEKGESAEARFVYAMDKVEAYQFALNNRAALHLMREEKFETLVQMGLPKTFIDETAFNLMKDIFKEMGRKWPEWCTTSIDGDPNEIVEQEARKLEEEHARLRKQIGERALAEATAAKTGRNLQIGNVCYVGKWLSRGETPTSPPSEPVAA